MLTTALFIIAKIWKHPKCTSKDKWKKKMWCMHTQRSTVLAICDSMDEP